MNTVKSVRRRYRNSLRVLNVITSTLLCTFYTFPTHFSIFKSSRNRRKSAIQLLEFNENEFRQPNLSSIRPQRVKSPPESPSIYICVLLLLMLLFLLRLSLSLLLLLLYICISPLMYRTKSLQIIITYIRVRTCANAYIGTRIYIHT